MDRYSTCAALDTGRRDESAPAVTPSTQQPLELILARNLMSSLDIPSFLVDNAGMLVFYNDSAGDLLGKRFEEIGRRTLPEWNEDHRPFEQDGRELPTEELPFTIAVRESRPVHKRFQVRPDGGAAVEIEASAVPLSGADGCQGAIVVFWPVEGP
jgi:PAS domain-containing protein